MSFFPLSYLALSVPFSLFPLPPHFSPFLFFSLPPILRESYSPLLRACISSLIGLVTRVRYYSIYSDQVRIMVPIQTTAMAEMAAGVIICCGPSAAVVCRSIKDLPVRSWLSPPRIIGGSSHSKILLSDQAVPCYQANKDSSLLQSIVDPRGASNDVEVDSYRLGRLEPVHIAGIGKMTEFSVSHTTN